MSKQSEDTITRLNAALEGQYQLERELGEGGMATVYLATDLKHERQVALKVLKPDLAAAVGAQRFLEEIRTTAHLQHPHILPLFDSGEADSFLFYVMPYVEGATLQARLEREGRLSLRDALSIIEDVAAALSHAHAHGVIHRDIKPANILIADGEALVADFGIALAVANVERDRLTATGLSLGTPVYMSPEQISGNAPIDGRSDVYSLGCLLYEMLAGEAPFPGTVPSVLAKTLSEPAPSIRTLRPEIPHDIDVAIRRAMAKLPDERFESARAFFDACATSLAPTRGRRVPRVALPLAGLVVVAIGFAAWRTSQISHARGLLPEISRLADAGQYGDAYELAIAASRWIEGDTALATRLLEVSDLVTITSDPVGAQVTLQRFTADASDAAPPQVIGVTPITDYRIPRIDHRVVLTLDGFLPAERIASSTWARTDLLVPSPWKLDLSIPLAPVDRTPRDMVAVPGGEYRLVSPDVPAGLSTVLSDFLIDRHEVTNEAFRSFILNGGYGTDEYWTDAPGQARAGFLDRTGLPGPREWVRQDFGEQKERFPVAGVTWHEASAYCRSVEKRLPTVYEWEKTARDGVVSHTGILMPWGVMTSSSLGARRANFSSDGTTVIDAFPFGLSPFGAYGMAGNVREWAANPYGDGFAVTGGSWEAPSYLYSAYGAQLGTFASPALGFRCARSEGPSDQGVDEIDLDTSTPAYTPVDEDTFHALLAYYQYDRRVANPRTTDIVDTPAWTRERIWIDGPAADSVLLYFYAPKSTNPPYQTIVYVPGNSAFCCQMVSEEAEWAIGPSIQAGRAVLTVVLKGMLERGFAPGFQIPEPSSVLFRDVMVQQATELRLGIDYIETRDDVDRNKLAYVGLSFGAGSRLTFSVVDHRYQAVVYIGGGIDERVKPTLPEADNVNFAPYISVPTIMINGREDEEHPWVTRGLPLWNLLTEPKELVLIDDGGHIVPLEDRIPAINGFLDRTLGPVEGR